MIAQAVVHRPIDLAAREHSEHPVGVHHRKALEPVTPHPLGRAGNGIGRPQRLRHAVGHDLADGDGRMDVVLQQIDQRLENRGQRTVADQRGRGAAVAPAA